MASGYLDLAYLIEISIVFNLAYREIKHGSVLNKMKQIREKMSRDKELQERVLQIKADTSLAGDTVESNYKQLIAITECDENKSSDCTKTDSDLCEAWKHNTRSCKYFVNTVLTGKGLKRVNFSILTDLLILLFATTFSHLPFSFYIELWWFLLTALVATIGVPIYLLIMSEKVENLLVGKNGQNGRIWNLEEKFNNSYNKYIVEKKATGDFI